MGESLDLKDENYDLLGPLLFEWKIFSFEPQNLTIEIDFD